MKPANRKDPLGVAVHIAALAVQSSPEWVKGIHEGTSDGIVTLDVFNETNLSASPEDVMLSPDRPTGLSSNVVLPLHEVR